LPCPAADNAFLSAAGEKKKKTKKLNGFLI